MAYTIEDSNLVVKKPNTGWPDLLPTQQFQWQVDVTLSAEEDSPTYSSIQIYRTTDNVDVTSDFSPSGSGSQSGKFITSQLCTVPADAKSVEYHAILWWLDGGRKDADIIIFRVLNG